MFRRKIRGALWNKIEFNQELQRLMIKNRLPYLHYYSYGHPEAKVVEPDGCGWMLSFIERCAEFLRQQ